MTVQLCYIMFPITKVQDREFDGVPGRLYQRKDRPTAPGVGVIFIHGGGFVFGSVGKCRDDRLVGCQAVCTRGKTDQLPLV